MTTHTHTKLILPIGYDNFGKIIENGLYFVDKSLLIQDILDDVNEVLLITRPRRFGKTLNLSMLHHYLAANVYGRDTTHLFEGLKITQAGAAYTVHQGKYPVIFITLKGMSDHTYEQAYARFCGLMADLYHEYFYLLDGGKLSGFQKDTFNAILGKKATEDEIKCALKNLTHYLFLHHGERPWLLIDEYDSPIHAAYVHHYYEPMVNLMRSVLGEALKTNPYLNRALITGILRVAKESIFSGLNNIGVYSLLRPQYADYFGFTDIEVRHLFEKAELPVSLDDVKNWYNGYQIGPVTLYNPWSIVNCIHNKGAFGLYWVNTSGNELIRELLAASGVAFKSDLKQLLAGQAIRVSINETIVFVDLKSSPTNVWSLLFMAGYLKLISREKNTEEPVCELTIPNQEILALYRGLVRSWLGESQHLIRYDELLNDLLDGRVDLFEKQLSDILMAMASHHDMAREPEAFYHGFLLGLTASLSPKHYMIKSNRESGLGRYDIAILPKDNQKMAILLELKSTADSSEAGLTQSAERALQQIKTKQYATECQQAGYTHVALIGIAFCGKAIKIIHQ